MWQVHWLHKDVIHTHSINAELRDNNIKIPAEMAQNLMILHSYILVKVTEEKVQHTILNLQVTRNLSARLYI